MDNNKEHFRHILLFYYRKGKNAAHARKKLADVYGEDVFTVRQCQNWFARFRTGNFNVEDAPRSGRPVEADRDMIKALVDENPRITTREIGERLNLSNSTVYDHLKGLGLTSKLDVWVPNVSSISSKSADKLPTAKKAKTPKVKKALASKPKKATTPKKK